MGIPTVGGEVYFDKSYNGNILVNAFTLGVCGKDEIFKAVASGVGNKVIYAGSRTGRDGIHGAGLLASKAFQEDAEEKRPTVQVGDPFQEKKLLEACLEVMKKKLIVGIQDMGAAGLSSSSLEMAGRAGTGIIMHLDRVPTREAGMTPYELMLSESQERMLIVAEPHMVDKVREVFEKWDLNAVEVGEVTGDGFLKLFMHGELVAEMPAAPLSEEAPVYKRPYSRPSWQSSLANLDLDKIPQPTNFNEIFKKLITSANLCSREWVYNQYDSTVGTDTVFEPGYDAALMRVKGHQMGIAISSDCNSRYCYLDPRSGGKLAIIESARNVACTGARPIAFTNCLNFGNPEKPEIMWQFVEAVDGISEAAEALDTPVVSGNVSFYNETGDSGIKPTPTIVMVGVIEDINKAVGTKFIAQGDKIVLLGTTRPELGGSEYLELIHGITAGLPPVVNLDRERNLHNLLIDLSKEQVINSAHDISDGGFAVALAECLLTDPVRLGAKVELESELRPDAVLFGESQGRVIITVSPDELNNLRKMAVRYGIECEVIGEVDLSKTLKIKLNSEEVVSADMADIYKSWSSKFAEIAGE
jgi:phosphoribosylformylglycinamidine synthase